MTKQKSHIRRSKKGRYFRAGRRKTKRCYLCKQPTPLDEGRVVPVDEIWNKQFCCDNCIDIGHGGKIGSKRYCPYCGTELKDTKDAYEYICPKCGGRGHSEHGDETGLFFVSKETYDEL